MPDVSAAELVAAIRALPDGAGPASGAVRRLRDAWGRASALARAQAALLTDAAWRPLDLSHDRLPRLLALATLASAEEWTVFAPAEAEDRAAAVLRRLAAAGYPADGLEPLDVVAAAWLPGPAGADTHTDQIARARALVGDASPSAADLRLACALLHAARRAWLAERFGVVLPAEARRALEGMSLGEAAAASGAAKGTLSRVGNGRLRAPDGTALWLLHRLEARDGPGGRATQEVF